MGIDFAGGQDNQAGLLEGFELASKLGAGDLIWFHGNQPVRFEKSGGLEQILERSFSRPRVNTVDLGGGANRILEDLGKVMRIDGQERPSSVGEVVGCVRSVLRGDTGGMKWSRVGSEEEVGDGVKVWDQLARWKVWSELEDVKPGEALVALAARYQLVTPVSGAVVLETKADYEENGLEAVDVDSVPKIPVVPEPSVSLMMMLGALLMMGRRVRGRE